MAEKKGWIHLHRKIQDCTLWDSDEPFDRRSAWIDLLLLANHDDKKTLFDGKPVIVKRGQRITSVRQLADRWHWGNQKTLKYLRMLEEENMITRNSDKRRTLLTIVNYGVYNDVPNTDGTLTEQQQNTDRTLTEHSQNTDRPQTRIIENDKNEKNEKEGNIPEQKKSDDHIDEIMEIIEYLNQKKGSGYSYKTVLTQKMIRGRLSEGYTVDDFKSVIDAKCSQWLNDKNMVTYLQPSTLFAPSHFESYLEQSKVKRSTTAGTNSQQRTMQLLAEYQKQIEQEEGNEEE